MATTEYLPVAVASGANVDSQGSFAGATYQLVGFTTGTARATQANKVWRQSSMVSAAWANVIVNVMGQNVLDDGNLPNLVSQLTATVSQIATAAINASGLLARLITAETNIVALQNGMAGLTATVNNNVAQINSLFARMAAAEGNIGELQQNVGTLMQRMATAEGSINSINGSVNWLTTQVNGLLGRMGNMENAISTINGQIADIYNRLNSLDNAINGINGQIGGINNQIGGMNAHLGQLDNQVAQLMPQGVLSGNGWTSLPNGLILQWMQGPATGANGSQITSNFPRSFPQACLFASVNTRHAGGGNYGAYPSATIITWGQSSVTWWWNRNADQGGFSIIPLIFAIGF